MNHVLFGIIADGSQGGTIVICVNNVVEISLSENVAVSPAAGSVDVHRFANKSFLEDKFVKDLWNKNVRGALHENHPSNAG